MIFDWMYIYGLRILDTTEYRYIGQTNDISRRLLEHKNKKFKDYEKEAWIESVLSDGHDIEIVQIEKCDKQIINSRERYWIKHYTNLGHRLLNKRLVTK